MYRGELEHARLYYYTILLRGAPSAAACTIKLLNYSTILYNSVAHLLQQHVPRELERVGADAAAHDVLA